MKILVTGDLHFKKQQFQWIEAHQNDYDCLCLTGDFLDSARDDFYEQVKWVASWLKNLNRQIFICSGNHDLDDYGECEWLEALNGGHICTDGHIKVFNGLKFGCIPYLGADLLMFSDCDILLSHVPPSNTTTSRDLKSGRDFGDEQLNQALKSGLIQPGHLFSGHVENPLKKRDMVLGCVIINPGSKCDKIAPFHAIISVPD